ncbi:MAG TPA: type I methionyl aminopeptidase [Streptosporangiaceae bacterium]
MVALKTSSELAIMREAGRVVARTLQRVARAAAPGVRLAELDEIAEHSIKEHDAKPSFLHYHPQWSATPYPATLCLSVNDVVVHGIPDARALAAGDILSVDCGAELGGYHGDAAITIPVGAVDDAATRLIEATAEALRRAIEAAVPGNRLGDVGYAVESVARGAGYGILDGCTGHGVGTAMHEDPAVPNIGRPRRGMRLREGLTIAIEPMLIEGGHDDGRLLQDGWAIATGDGSRAAHFEHTIAVTADGPLVLTAP